MRRNFWVGVILILAIIGFSSYVAWPATTKLLKRDVAVRQGLDLQGGVRLAYQLDLANVPAEDRTNAIESTRRVIEARVNTTGVAEPLIQPAKVGATNTVIVELPGITDVQQAIDLIGKTAQLEFKELDPSSTEQDPKWLPTSLSGKQLKKATVSFDQTTNAPQVSLQFNGDGSSLFAHITERNIGKPLAIFLDDQILSAPNVNEKISGGEAVINGQFTVEEVKQLVSLLNAGALDVPIKLIEQHTVGATLGADSVKKSLVAGIIGLLLVALFMIINYRLAGFIAVLALISYSIITLALFKYIPVTLTLAGIAGFILSIGMAVDANILIFERLREEVREGKSLRIALEEAFRRAWPSVRDSNASTIITCVILYYTTTGSVRGFAFTLALGVAVSLFSSITVSRAFLRLLSLSPIGERQLEKNLMEHYLFLGKKKKVWFLISIGLFIIGIIFLSIWRLPFGIDFKGGAQMDLSFEKQVGEAQLRDKVSSYPDVRGLVVTKTDQTDLTLKMLPITDDQHQALIKKINEDFGTTVEKQYQLVGPSVSQDLTRKAVIAVILASLFIVLYLAYAFRTVTFPVSSWRFGVVAVVALLHDLVITVGVFSILAHLFHYEVDASFVTALLTVMGFSVHDTIVVFDRVRENLTKHKGESLSFESIADMSLGQTLNRSLATSLTVIITLTALTIMGGASIRGFVVTLLVGIAIGTYSSIFTATPLLAVWQNRADRRGKNV